MKRQINKEVQRVVPPPISEFGCEYLPRGSKTICIPCTEQEYMSLLENNERFKNHIDNLYQLHPEIFPNAFEEGYVLNGYTETSQKITNFRMRRIKMLANKQVYAVRPSCIMPYMTAYTENVEKALYLRRYGVPYSALSDVFGENDMFWYRAENSFGRNSIVGTLIKDPEKLLQSLSADEKETHFNGEKIYIAETVAQDCVLGAAACTGRSTTELAEGYGVMAAEASMLDPQYEPETVNTDSSKSTMGAWKDIFSQIFIIRCFLHAFINIRDRCRKYNELFDELKQQVWHVYRASGKPAFAQRLRRLKEWSLKNLPEGVVLEKVLSLCSKSTLFQQAYDHPNAHRTSNMIDRLMKKQDRYLFNMQYFHGHFQSAELNVRAWAIRHNFRPYCARVAFDESVNDCPATRLNDFKSYTDNWLENLLVSASMGGYRQ